MTFAEFCRSFGLIVEHPPADGRWHRCNTEDHPKKKNGGYLLNIDGRSGAAINFATMLEHAAWRAGDEVPAPTQAELDALRRRNERLKAETKRKKQDAAAEARAFYADCKPLHDSHPYLTAHQLTVRGCEGLKVDDEDWLVVPAWAEKPDGSYEIVTVQRISPDGKKLFWRHAPADGATYMIARDQASVTVLTEGLATGLALYSAISTSPAARVIVAFSAHNLYHRRVVGRVPDGSCVVAADNDHGTEKRLGENPGVVAASRAAVLLRCGVAVPKCVGTDWADFREERFRFHKDRLGGYEHDSAAWMRAEADVRRAVLPHQRMNGLIRYLSQLRA